MGFLYSDQKARMKVLAPWLADVDSTKFNTWSDAATKISMAQMQATYIDTGDKFAKLTTLSGTAPVSGSKIISTTVGDTYEVPLVTGAVKVAGDDIWLYNPASGEYKTCPRTEIENIVVGGTGETIVAFFEVNGNIVIYMKDGTFVTVPFKVQYDYWRILSVPAADSDPLDIKDNDFDTYIGIVMQYMPQA